MGGVISFLPPLRRDAAVGRPPSRIVQVATGQLEGFRVDVDDDRMVDLFLGVPFAKPPIGELRFRKPEPAEPWEGIRRARRFGPRAPQADFFWERWTSGVGKSEDCLYLNVFAPAWKANEEKGFAVLVFVHGGGFLIDSAVKYGDESIARSLCVHDVIVVTVQYRLGLLGFFSTGDSVCPGNLGLWDQTAALRWVKENISAFGGDASRITVFGQSAGGASVDLLAISPHSRDLFQQVIPMAGCSECEWATARNEEVAKECAEFAQRKGFTSRDPGQEQSREMIEFLRTKKAKEFERSLLGRTGVDVSKVSLELAPVLDGDFLPRSIDELRRETPKRRVMIGTCEAEGLLFALLAPNTFDERGINHILSVVITEERFPEDFAELRERARQLYLAGGDPTDRDHVARAYIKLYSDNFVGNGTSWYAEKMRACGNEVFLYSFDYCNPKSFGILALRAPFKAATHCTELAYLFGLSIVFDFKFSDADRRVAERLCRMWTNFAKYGNPNGPEKCYSDKSSTISVEGDVGWQPTTEEAPLQYLSIGEESCEMRPVYEERRADFWAELRRKGAEPRTKEAVLATKGAVSVEKNFKSEEPKLTSCGAALNEAATNHNNNILAK